MYVRINLYTKMTFLKYSYSLQFHSILNIQQKSNGKVNQKTMEKRTTKSSIKYVDYKNKSLLVNLKFIL